MVARCISLRRPGSVLAAAPEEEKRERKGAKRSGKGQGSVDVIAELFLVIAHLPDAQV